MAAIAQNLRRLGKLIPRPPASHRSVPYIRNTEFGVVASGHKKQMGRRLAQEIRTSRATILSLPTSATKSAPNRRHAILR